MLHSCGFYLDREQKIKRDSGDEKKRRVLGINRNENAENLTALARIRGEIDNASSAHP